MIDKPWGNEEILHTDEKYTLKRLFMKKGHKCSLQYHKYKQETIYVLEGSLKIIYDKSNYVLFPGEYLTIEPNVVHRMEGITNVTYLECSTSQLDDVVRIEDDYQRI